MTLSVRLSPDEELFLEKTARRLGRSKSDLARQEVHELCQKFVQEERSPYTLGLICLAPVNLQMHPWIH